MWLVARVLWLSFALGCGRHSFDPLARDGNGGDPDGDTETCEATFCDNFDREGPLLGAWDMFANSGGALGVHEASVSLSPPRSFLLELPSPALHQGMLVKQFGMAQLEARIKLAIRYSTVDASTAEIDLVRLRWLTLPPPCTSFGYFLVRDSTGPFDLQETYGGCGGNENTPFDNLENTGFHEIEMRVTFGPIGVANVRVDIDDITRVDKLTSHAIDPSMLELQVGGAAVRDTMAPWQIFDDDIAVELQ